MTYEEALYWLTHKISIDVQNSRDIQKDIECLETCEKVLEKQIAKRPVIQYDPPYENPADDEPWYLCPCCKNANIMYPEHHCECGQRLDWSEFRYPEKELEKWKKK